MATWLVGTEILPEIARRTGKPVPVSYRKMMDLAASGRLPQLMRRADGKLGCPPEELPVLAAALGAPIPADHAT